jgi:hypothetical protein
MNGCCVRIGDRAAVVEPSTAPGAGACAAAIRMDGGHAGSGHATGNANGNTEGFTDSLTDGIRDDLGNGLKSSIARSVTNDAACGATNGLADGLTNGPTNGLTKGITNGDQSAFAVYSYTMPWHVIGAAERATVLFLESRAPVNLEITPTGTYWSWKATAAGWTCAGAAPTPSGAKASALDAAAERYSAPGSMSGR